VCEVGVEVGGGVRAEEAFAGDEVGDWRLFVFIFVVLHIHVLLLIVFFFFVDF